MTNLHSIYCENFSSNFVVVEPVNTITNISFFIATLLLFNVYKKQQTKQIETLFLIVLLFFIGIGSTVWHLTQSLIGELLDMVPILLFLIIYIYSFSKKILKLSLYKNLVFLTCFVLATFYLPSLFKADPIKTSSGYIPAMFVLAFFTWFAFTKKLIIFKDLFISSFLFFISVIFRSLDFAVCNITLVGTHFIWHILNAFVLFYAVRALIIYRTK